MLISRLYLITEYVIYPKKNPSRKGKEKVQPDTAPVGGPSAVPSISALASGSDSPMPSSGTATPATDIESVKKSALLRTRAPRSDGGVVCALAVSEYCVKAGRVTVPPVSSLVIVAMGSCAKIQRIALHFSMMSKDKTKRDHARNLLFGNKDFGYGWLRGGWKEEKNAATLGMDIGHDDIAQEVTEEAEWVTKAKDGMEKVTDGLSVF